MKNKVELINLISLIDEELELLELMKKEPRHTTLSETPKGMGFGGDPISSLIIKIENLKALRDHTCEDIRRIDSFNETLSGIEQIIFEGRYVDGLKWKSIKANCDCSISLRQMYRIHEKLMKNFSEHMYDVTCS